MARIPAGPLRRGWTTGACATAATQAAYTALLTGHFPDPVTIGLPGGGKATFVLTKEELGPDFACAAVVKDAGDDPDVTHGALIVATVRRGPTGSGIIFRAGAGVGTVTKAGLLLAVGEPAINPVPRQMMRDAVLEAARAHGSTGDVIVEISVPEGEALAKRTWNPRLGIVGGISILGTTGIVTPYSCSAWIHSIHSGIDVARANGMRHVAGCTGSTSERGVQRLYGLPTLALIDMGDFAGGMLKYLRTHPLPQLTIAGGFAKLSKLAAGHLDLHSGRSRIETAWLAERLSELGAAPALVEKARVANTALEVMDEATAAGIDIAGTVAGLARQTAIKTLAGADVAVEVLVFDRKGRLVGRSAG
ncbi:MAG: cobalt-precorrin-5B (C(1))-methyltransferase [Alphaproteobacteria bacterium]|nr:cobalt-precorrin-5B (C(1))-methyltransferase [Alphaproteobacteria bacterium]